MKKQIPSRLSGEEITPATLYVEESLTVITGTERMKLLKQTPMELNWKLVQQLPNKIFD